MVQYRSVARTAVIVTCIVIGLATGILDAEVSERDVALLNSVRALREVTMRRISSGRIVALAAEEEALGEAKLKTKAPEHRVESIFSGNDSLVREWNGGEGSKLRRVILRKDGKKTKYNAPGNEMPSSLHIGKALPGVIFHPPLLRWTYQEVASVNIGCPDAVFWSAVFERYSLVKVEENGSIIRLTIGFSNEQYGILHDSEVIEFDMNMGGMVRRWSCNRLEKREGKDVRIEEHGEVEWEHNGAMIVPTRRTASVVFTTDGKRSFHNRTNVKFLSVSCEEIGPEELSVQKMGVAVGTPVVDTITGLEYRYGAKGKFGDPEHELSAKLMADKNSIRTPPAQGGPQKGETQPIDIKHEEDTHAPQPKRSFPNVPYVIVGVGLLLVILLGSYFVIKKVLGGRQQ